MSFDGHTPSPGLRRTVGSLQFFALAFGCTVGSGWVVILGDWLEAAGPGGAIIGFIVGATVMWSVAACYAELSARLPVAGGEIVYAYDVFGPTVSFVVAWFLTLSMIAIGAFEGTALGWILGVLAPSAQGFILYHVLGAPVMLGSLIVAAVGLTLMTWLNYSGIRESTRFQTFVTFTFAAIAVLVVVVGLSKGAVANVYPLFQLHGRQSWWLGIAWMIGITPFTLNGFQAVVQAVEERTERTTFVRIARAMYWAVAFAAVFYIAIVLACAMAAPWRTLAARPLATAAAMGAVWPGGYLAQIVLIAAAVSILKSWNGVVLWASRLVLAQARVHFIPGAFGTIDVVSGSPRRAVLFVAFGNALGIILGRGALLPIVNMASICLSISLVLTCFAVIVLRQRTAARPARYVVPGGTFTIVYAAAGSALMATFALLSPLYAGEHRVPPEWFLMAGWAVVGTALWFITAPQRRSLGTEASRRALLGNS